MDSPLSDIPELPSVLRVLLVEDSQADADLILRALRDLERPVEHLRVASAPALLEALDTFAPDVILSDFSMPGFSGQEALTIAAERAPNLPFLYVSGAVGEHLAIDALQRGALDYVLKDNLRRLPSSVQRALHITNNRRQRERMQEALQESERRFRQIVESSRDWIWEMDSGFTATYNNSAVTRILGYHPDELADSEAMRFMHPDDRATVLERLPRLMEEESGWSGWRLRWHHRDGSLRVLESTAVPQLDQSGQLIGYRGVDHDITERLQQEARIQQLSRIHALLSAVSSDVLRAPDRDKLLYRACRLAVEHGGFSTACIGISTEGQGLELDAAHGDPDVIAFVQSLCQLPPQETTQVPEFVAFRQGQPVIVDDVAHNVMVATREAMLQVGVRAQVVLPIGSPAWGVMGLYSRDTVGFDEEEVRLLERLVGEIDHAIDFLAKGERLKYLAFRNTVTGLPNRNAFLEQLEVLLERGPTVVAVLNVQRFGRINASRGRDFGDELLRQAAIRLQELAGPDALLAHPEADTYALARLASGPEEAERARLESLMEAFGGTSLLVEGEEVHVDLRAGMAISPKDGIDSRALKRNAVAALTESRLLRSRIHAFNEELLVRGARRLELERDLRRAVEAGEFELFYQPKCDATTHRVIAAEALLRWRHPTRGLISPAEFIPVLEDTGLIVRVGHWVMRTAAETAVRWRDIGLGAFRICVNVSARELANPRFLDDCNEILQPYADDQVLDIELTESLLMNDIQHSIHLLGALREFGCKIAIDDFGTGYSSLNYLARLPVDTLKIDQSFVALLDESPQAMSLITNIINLAHSLSMSVVAEGVETDEQAKLLRLLRCDVLQGYLLGRPMPESEFASKFL